MDDVESHQEDLAVFGTGDAGFWDGSPTQAMTYKALCQYRQQRDLSSYTYGTRTNSSER